MATTYYHCTPRTNEASIDAEGLETDGTWFIHFSENHPFGHFIAHLHEQSEVVIYKVDLEGYELQVGYDGEGTVMTKQPVPPERLTKVGIEYWSLD